MSSQCRRKKLIKKEVMTDNWIRIYRADEEYQVKIIQQLLEGYGLHPVVMDRKDDEFRIGEVELFIAPEEAGKAQQIISENERRD